MSLCIRHSACRPLGLSASDQGTLPRNAELHRENDRSKSRLSFLTASPWHQHWSPRHVSHLQRDCGIRHRTRLGIRKDTFAFATGLFVRRHSAICRGSSRRSDLYRAVESPRVLRGTPVHSERHKPPAGFLFTFDGENPVNHSPFARQHIKPEAEKVCFSLLRLARPADMAEQQTFTTSMATFDRLTRCCATRLRLFSQGT